MTIEQFREQGFLSIRDARKDELLESWEPQEVAVTLWGKVATLRGISVDQLKQQVPRGALRQPQAVTETAAARQGQGLEAFINFKRRRV